MSGSLRAVTRELSVAPGQSQGLSDDQRAQRNPVTIGLSSHRKGRGNEGLSKATLLYSLGLMHRSLAHEGKDDLLRPGDSSKCTEEESM